MSKKAVPHPQSWAGDQRMTYFAYLQRRYRAGEEGGRLPMENVLELFLILDAFERPVTRGGPEQKTIENACAMLYVDPEKYLGKEEGTAADAGEA